MDLDLEKLKAAAEQVIDGKAKIETHGIYGCDLIDRIVRFREEATPEVVSSLIAKIERLKLALENEKIESQTLRHGLRLADDRLLKYETLIGADKGGV